MTRLLLAGLSLLLSTAGKTQVAKEFQVSTPRMLAYNNLPREEQKETVQTNFIEQNWRAGLVRFKGSSNEVGLPLIFDVYSNELYFLLDGKIMEFSQPVQEFTIAVVSGADTLRPLFRSGYPAVHKNGAATFYEVLVDGRFQLLKCKAKTISLYKDHEVPEAERDYSKELLYAQLPDGSITLVKPEKEALLKAMPAHAALIESVCTAKKIRLKNEAQLQALFLALNE